jgi:hypothetical protein
METGRSVTMNQPKPPFRPAGPNPSAPAKPGATPPSVLNSPAKPAAPRHAVPPAAKPGAPPPTERSGKVVHDARGNAVWDWLKETSRIAIESTTRMLRKLEAPELKMEETHEEELRIMPDDGKCVGGGYDPYNQANKGRKSGK